MADKSDSSADPPKIQRLDRVDESDQTLDTFVLHGHDHTLGNPLRHMILKDKRTEFCGYSVIHPTEENIHLRVQTKPGSDASALDVLKTGLKNLKSVCQYVGLEYDDAIEAHKAKMEEGQ